MDNKTNYLIIITNDPNPQQLKAYLWPKKFGNIEFFECFKKNLKFGPGISTAKWEFLDKNIFISVHRIQEMFIMNYVTDKGKNSDSY